MTKRYDLYSGMPKRVRPDVRGLIYELRAHATLMETLAQQYGDELRQIAKADADRFSRVMRVDARELYDTPRNISVYNIRLQPLAYQITLPYDEPRMALDNHIKRAAEAMSLELMKEISRQLDGGYANGGGP